jgi:hypothetical protein
MCVPPGPLPARSPTDYLFQPEQFLAGDPAEAGPVLDVREPPFLEHPATPQEVKVRRESRLRVCWWGGGARVRP